jgi:hypothetical protein
MFVVDDKKASRAKLFTFYEDYRLQFDYALHVDRVA